MNVCTSSSGGQKRASTPLELELQAVVSRPMWVLGTRLNSLPLSHPSSQ